MRGVFDHVTLRASDPVASARFYRTVLTALGIKPSGHGEEFQQFSGFSVAPARADRPTTTGLHIGFVAPSEDAIHAFWQAGVDAGYRSDGPPGPRPQYSADYYGAFLLDPDGNSIEAARHGRLRDDGGPVDHLWMRVADVPASKAFYEAVAPHCSIELVADTPELARFRGAQGGSLTVVRGEPLTRGVHFAFPAPDTDTVDAFHAAALAAGSKDHGAPGERPEYHRGYYGAFVLDPGGQNVDAVFHGRA